MAVGEIIVLGLDPGSRVTGFGFVREISGRAELLAAGTVRPDPKLAMAVRLGEIFSRLSELLSEYRPQEAAVESVFTARNAQSALKLGQARGAAMAACAVHRVPLAEYEPSKVKKSLVGSGRAEKGQVAFMVGRILGCKPDWALDTSDALAVAICHLNMRRMARLAGLTPPD